MDSLEKIVKWAISHGFSTGHASNMDDLLEELSWQIKELRDN